MKNYFGIVLAGFFVISSTLVASAEQPVQIVVAGQSVSTSAPVEATVQFDSGSDPNTAPRVVHGPFDEGGHFVAGAGAYIMKPYFQNNPAFFMRTTTIAGGLGTFSMETSTCQHDFCWGLDAAPVVWLGYVSECGLGVRARWWLFDQRSATSAVSDTNTAIISASPAGLSIVAPPSSFPGIGIFPSSTQMFLSSNLKLDVWDFEATAETEVGRWNLLFSGGFRYAHLSQDYNALEDPRGSLRGIFFPTGGSPVRITSPENLVSQNIALSSGHNFNGAGPTLALEARRPIGNSGFSLFANLRGTILFGESKQQVDQPTITQFGFGFFNPFTTVAVTNAGSVRDTVLPVAELEMGAEYSRTWGAVRPFFRTGLVAQTWFDAGSASQLDGNLGFLGLSVTAGLNY
jgi:hypothetical protein